MADDPARSSLPVRIAERAVELRGARSPAELRHDVDELRAITAIPPSRILRRLLLMWFRIYVNEHKASGDTRVNLRIPIPLPVVGLLMAYRLPRRHALKALALVEGAADPAAALGAYLDSVMGLELIRVDESKASGNRTIVVLGFD